MKHLSKLLAVLIIITLATPSFAQVVGVRAGFNLANQYMEEDGETLSDDFSMNPGFHVGLLFELPATTMVSFETGVNLTTKGFKLDATAIEGVTAEGSVNLYYVDIPLLAKFNFGSEMLNVYAKIGPYVGVGLFGTSKSEFSFMGETISEDEDIEWGSSADDHYRRLDFGATAGVGVEFFPIRVGVAYDYGLANIVPVQDNDSRINNRVFRISLAYLF